ncbi:diacylglycerol kinase [Streptomyces ovatisporus]|uniref:Diacylglycerol kinase n=1 Tax=Streptomyces ovatisporus TaxID=1128682 RepID=A0ABV9AA95_9ACTN
MSAPDPTGTSQLPLLVVIDPAARLWDGESVRIARDVLSAGAPGVKVCLPESPEETERALVRRGSRRPVVVGDDTALLRAVRLLHRERELSDVALSVVPVGAEERVRLACGLGVPPDAVTAARTVLDGAPHRLGLLTDDSGGVVLGDLRIPDRPAGRRRSEPDGQEQRAGGERAGERAGQDAPTPSLQGLSGLAGLSRTRRSLSRSVRAVRAGRGMRGDVPVPPQRLRVEADGVLLADLDEPVREVSVKPAAGTHTGLAQVTVRPQAEGRSGPVLVKARAVTVSGPDFHYRADALVGGPVRVRTWTALAQAWSLMLPA